FRPRLPELAPYRVPSGQPEREQPQMHQYRVGVKYYRRVLGERAPAETFSGRETQWRGTKLPRPGTQDDQSANRVADMDEEGVDTHFLIPTSWLSLVGLDDPTLELGMVRAYHRHMSDFCADHPDRLKSPIVASSRNVEESVREIREWGKSKWAVAVLPLLAKDMPADHPDLYPIWQAAADHDLAIANHSFTWTPPYYPGYLDLWENIFIGRAAAHPWGAMRFVASFIGGGLFDRFPTLRMGVLEGGFGWLPFWAKRLDEQAVYVGGTAPLKHKPSEYMQSGRFFCSIEHHEGEDMFAHVTGFLGDNVLMYASDYPHSECQFPNSVDNILAWSLNEDTKKKLLSGNATRFFKQT
ncbi:MAG TPA: amidohydrolase family protein, partial [Stellaceae bacterium]|nr:amidohydrolase family protein [Stellaceae bacterium]